MGFVFRFRFIQWVLCLDSGLSNGFLVKNQVYPMGF